jgi:hypothetical protein
MERNREGVSVWTRLKWLRKDQTAVFVQLLMRFRVSWRLMNAIEHNYSGQADGWSSSQEIIRFLWNPQVHYLIYKRLPLVRILSQLHAAHTFEPYFCFYSSRFLGRLKDPLSAPEVDLRRFRSSGKVGSCTLVNAFIHSAVCLTTGP